MLLDFTRTHLDGFSFLIEIISWQGERKSLKTGEVAIIFLDREFGSCGISLRIVIKSLARVIALRFSRGGGCGDVAIDQCHHSSKTRCKCKRGSGFGGLSRLSPRTRSRFCLLRVPSPQDSEMRLPGTRKGTSCISSMMTRSSLLDCFVLWSSGFAMIASWRLGDQLSPDRTDSFLQKCFGYALGAYFGSLGMSYKFKAYGWVKEATERDLILANLALRREVFLSAGRIQREPVPQ